jgi:hypothetical protein
VSSALPSAPAQTPTATSVAAPAFCAVYVVDEVVVTVTVVVVGDAVAVEEAVPSPRTRNVSWTVIVSPLTAVTRPATARRPKSAPPRPPVPFVAVPVGGPVAAPAGGVAPAPGAPAAPPGPPAPPNPPAHSPFVAGRTSTDAAVTWVAGPDVADPVALPLAAGSSTVTHVPTVTSLSAALATVVNVVVSFHDTAVWSVRVWTCIVEPLTAAMSPFTPGCR